MSRIPPGNNSLIILFPLQLTQESLPFRYAREASKIDWEAEWNIVFLAFKLFGLKMRSSHLYGCHSITASGCGAVISK